MADVNIVTGATGLEHITPDDIGHGNAGIIGSNKYVLPVGNKFAPISFEGRTGTISTGDAMINGRHVRTTENHTFTVEPYSGSYTRYDLLCLKYTTNSSYSINYTEEKVAFEVLPGTPATNPADPAIPSPNNTILNGQQPVYMPLHRIVISGGAITRIEPVYVVSPALSNTLYSDDGTNVKVNDTVLGTIDNLSYVMSVPTSCSFTLNSTYVNWDTAQTRIWRWGHQVTLQLMGALKSNLETWQDRNIGTISPAPPAGIHFYTYSNDSIPRLINILPDGTMLFRTLGKAVDTVEGKSFRGINTFYV